MAAVDPSCHIFGFSLGDVVIELCFALAIFASVPDANLYLEIDMQDENIKSIVYSQEDKQFIIGLLCPPEIELVDINDDGKLVVMK